MNYIDELLGVLVRHNLLDPDALGLAKDHLLAEGFTNEFGIFVKRGSFGTAVTLFKNMKEATTYAAYVHAENYLTASPEYDDSFLKELRRLYHKKKLRTMVDKVEEYDDNSIIMVGSVYIDEDVAPDVLVAEE